MNKFHIYPGNYSYLIKEGLLRRGNWHEEADDSNPFLNCHFIWKPTNLSISEYIKLDSITKSRPKNFLQAFNHFENIRGICTKTGLVRSLKKYYQSNYDSRHANYRVFDSTPTSFLITAGVEDAEYGAFIARYKEIARQSFNRESIPQKHCEGNYWLVKPANLNQGRGIEVFKNLKEINNFLNSRPHNSFWVVQKYIEKPLLYHGRKFDIRVWVLVTNKNEIFVYKKAYIRTSSDDYDLKTSKNYVHLTNNCLQKYGENYGKHEDGNTLPLETLEEYLKALYPDFDVKLSSHILPRIKDLIIDSILCAKNLNPNHRKNVFELFGFDFLIDEDLRTWLIEVNTNPYLGIPNQYIAGVLPNMIDDMLEIAVDPIFPPKTKPRDESRPNYYELIYCEYGSTYHNGPLNLRSSFSKNVYPISSLVPPDYLKRLNQDSLHNSGDHSPSPNEEGEDAAVAYNRSGSAEQRGGSVKDQNKNTIESIHKQLCLTIVYKTDVNTSLIASQIGRVLSLITNWELLSKKEVKLACKTLILIAQSAGYCLLSDQSNILTITKLLKSPDVKLEIKFTMIETINILSKDITLRKKLICNQLLQYMIALCLSSCEEKEIQNNSKEFLLVTLKCLINLGGVFNRKLYIPGETREATKLRSFFIAQGGIIALWIISQKSLDNDMKECSKNFLSHLEFSDWERQLQVFDLAVSLPTFENTETGETTRKESIEEKKEDNGIIFYRTGDFQVMEKALNEKIEQSNKELERIIGFTREMLKIIPFEQYRKDFADYIKNLKEDWEKKEVEEREKRQQLESEKLKREEQRRKELEEQRRQALEGFEKRVKNNLKKQQMDIERRQKELEELKQKEMEIRKRNIEILMSKKATRERKQMKVRAARQESKRHHEEFEKGDPKSLKYYDVRGNRSPDLINGNEKHKTSLSNIAGTSSNPDLFSKNGAKKEANSQGLDGSDTENQKTPILVQEASKPDSNRSSPTNGRRYFSPTNAENPRGSNNVNFFASTNTRIDQKRKESGDVSVFAKDQGREKPNANFKLPKLQKAGRMMMAERMAQSPYLKGLDESISAKLKLKKDKENIKAKKQNEGFSNTHFNTQFSPYKVKVAS